MSSAKDKYQRISWGEIRHVQHLIERCVQRYMTQAEIVTAIQVEANVEPGFTCLVWQKLEEQNPSFFYVYNIMLRLKDQIVAYNYLMEKQKEIKRSALNSVPKIEDNNKSHVDMSTIFSSPSLDLSTMETE